MVVIFKITTGRTVGALLGIIAMNVMSCGKKVMDEFEVEVETVSVPTT